MKPLSKLLGIEKKEKVAIIGSGGKTSLLFYLASEWRNERAIITTTTKIAKPAPDEFDCLYTDNAFTGEAPAINKGINLLCREYNDKLIKIEGIASEILELCTDMADITLMECDGSKHMPLKGWNDYEPCVPDFTTVTIGVIALWAEGKTVCDSFVHRVPEYCALAKCKEGDRITIQQMSNVTCAPDGLMNKAFGRKILFINQIDRCQDQAASAFINSLPPSFIESLNCIVAGSLKNGVFEKYR